MRPTRKLGDNHCQCSGCGQYFNSDSAFEKHRIGQFGVERRCMTVAEMKKAGMSPNSGNWWVTEAWEGPAKVRGAPQDASVAEMEA